MVFYGEGGYAQSKITGRIITSTPSVDINAGTGVGTIVRNGTEQIDSKQVGGLYLGGGVDWKFTDNFLVGINYRHTTYDDVSLNVGNLNGLSTDSITVQATYVFK